MSSLVEFLRARLDEEEATIKWAGGTSSQVTWVSIYDQHGMMMHTTVAASHDEDHWYWHANGLRVFPDSPVRVIYDGALALADIEAKRDIIDMYQEQADYDLPEGISEGRDPDERRRDACIKMNLFGVLRILAEKYSTHPEYTSDLLTR